MSRVLEAVEQMGRNAGKQRVRFDVAWQIVQAVAQVRPGATTISGASLGGHMFMFEHELSNLSSKNGSDVQIACAEHEYDVYKKAVRNRPEFCTLKYGNFYTLVPESGQHWDFIWADCCGGPTQTNLKDFQSMITRNAPTLAYATFCLSDHQPRNGMTAQQIQAELERTVLPGGKLVYSALYRGGANLGVNMLTLGYLWNGKASLQVPLVRKDELKSTKDWLKERTREFNSLSETPPKYVKDIPAPGTKAASLYDYVQMHCGNASFDRSVYLELMQEWSVANGYLVKVTAMMAARFLNRDPITDRYQLLSSPNEY